MRDQLPGLYVQMFGKEKITYGGKSIILGKNSLTKAMKLLLILLHSSEEGIARQRLLEDLFGREELADASNNLRVTLFRLKKMLISSGLPEHEYIVTKNGKFYWDSPMETTVDVLVFKQLIEKAEKETNQEAAMALRKEACEMYTGEFLQKLSGDEWVIMESVHYKNMYAETLEKLCDYLLEQKEYEEVLKLTQVACDMYPFDEWQSYRMDCYIAMNRYKEAFKEYENTAKLLIEELGMRPSERMMNQFKSMSAHISNRPQIINEIKEGLQEEKLHKGAFFCTLPGFRDTYRVIRRTMERTGQSVFLMVCTLTDAKGRPMESSDKLDQMAEGLYHAIQDSCRRCDSFTKYSHSQFLVLLMGTNEENCQIVINRILGNYAKQHKSWADHLVCSVTSLYDLEQEELYFGSSK